jgi:2-succinyl-6-hydroxy-2,4-cyclohexadiene-1-carboxylate synthase
MTILLHGFWGQPSDWNDVIQKLPLGAPIHAPDLYAPGELSPHYPLKDWAQNFWRWADEMFPGQKLQIVGYSMGARLAVTAVTANPEQVDRALFLSGNPIVPKSDQPERETWENEWVQKFLKEDWPALETAWQDQTVFAGAPELPRRKTPEMREVVGLSLKQWSPCSHPFTFEQVKALSSRMEWAFGALDQKYVELAKSLQELPVQGQITIIPQARHRLITEAADFISAWIEKGSS